MTEDPAPRTAGPAPRSGAAKRSGLRRWLLRPVRLVQLVAAIAVVRWLAIPRLSDTGEVGTGRLRLL